MAATEDTALGEDLRVPVRIITAPATGTFTVGSDIAVAGALVRPGEMVGWIQRSAGPVEVLSPHAGRLAGLLAHPGERVREGQPLVWLHASG